MKANTTGAPSHRILYIADDKGFAMLAKFLLECMGHLVTVFEIPQQALDALAATPRAWDIVITDLRMPGWNGLDFARTVRDRHPGLAYGVISADLGSNTAGAADAAGLGPILPKPTSLEEFDSLVERIVGQARRLPPITPNPLHP